MSFDKGRQLFQHCLAPLGYSQPQYAIVYVFRLYLHHVTFFLFLRF